MKGGENVQTRRPTQRGRYRDEIQAWGRTPLQQGGERGRKSEVRCLRFHLQGPKDRCSSSTPRERGQSWGGSLFPVSKTPSPQQPSPDLLLIPPPPTLMVAPAKLSAGHLPVSRFCQPRGPFPTHPSPALLLELHSHSPISFHLTSPPLRISSRPLSPHPLP